MTANDIAKLAIAELARKQCMLTPQNYEQAYEEIALKAGASSGRADRIAGYIARLNEDIAQDARMAAPQSDAQLISFLISRINSASSQQAKAELKAAQVLAKFAITLLEQHPQASVRDLAAASVKELAASPHNVINVRNNWLARAQTLENEYEELAKKRQAAGLSGDMAQDVAALPRLFAQSNAINAIYEQIAPVMASALSTSIADEANTQIALAKEQLAAKPALLAAAEQLRALEQLVKKRIEIDRAEISSSHKALDDLLADVGKKIEHILGLATTSEEKIAALRAEIAEIKSDNEQMEAIKQRLLHIVESLESEVCNLREQSLKDVNALGQMQQKVSGLQKEIDKLKEESQQDFLTQLYNKRYLDEQLAAAEDSYETYNINYSVGFFDIDNFKLINDTYGHTAGDAILAAIGAIMQQHARKLDTPGRYGGEEFMLIMPHTDAAQAMRVAEAIREQVAAHKFIYKKHQIVVNISGGVAERSAATSARALIDQADALLYAAKAAGKNNIKG